MANQTAMLPTLPTKSTTNNKKKTTQRKYEYPPAGHQAPMGTLRVHSNETRTARDAGRILQQWTRCTKPRSEPRNGCSNGFFGYFVRDSNGVIWKAVWVGNGNGECDWDGEEVSQEQEDGDGIEDAEKSN